jgi:hypothetical protein
MALLPKADRQAHPSAAVARNDSVTNPATRVRAEEAYLSANLTAYHMPTSL